MELDLQQLQILWHLLTAEQKKLDRQVAKHDMAKNLVARDMASNDLRQVTEIKSLVGLEYQKSSKTLKNEQ